MKKQIKKTTLENVLSVIRKWERSNDVVFIGSFLSFNKKCEVKEDRLIAYGDRKAIKISLSELNKLIKEDKSEFINW